MKMKRKLYVVGVLIAGLLAAQAHAGPGIVRAHAWDEPDLFQQGDQPLLLRAGPGIV